MARLLTSGFELNRVGTVATEPDGLSAGAAAITIVASPVRSGGFAASCASGAGNATSYVRWTATTSTASTDFFVRAYMCFAQLPASAVAVLSIGLIGTDGLNIKLTSGGVLQLFDSKANTQIGSDSAGTITADGATFYRIEIKMTNNAGSLAASGEGQLDGTSFASGAIATPALATNRIETGWVQAPGATKTCYVDDMAYNDSSGGSQNSYPGSSQIVLLVPTATSAAGTGWVLGNNTAEGGNGWNSVNNLPPIGVGDLSGAGADAAQIRNATAAANSNFDATMTTYTAAGVPTGATVNVVDPITATGAPVVTSSKQGTVGVASNPAITNVALAPIGVAGAFWQGVTAGTYVTGWKWSHSTITYAPAVTLGTAPVMRVTQVTSSTRIAMVCFMGIYVDYTPAAVTFIAAPIEARYQQAVYRAASF